MTKEFALASGHAELYERFCNGMIFGVNPYWNRLLIKENMEKHGYHYRADEKLLSIDEVTDSCARMKRFLNYITNNNPILIKKYIQFITNNQPVGVPMNNIANENDKLYMDPRMLLRLTRSIGMSAGNTLEEALNQGISELLEVQAKMNFFRDWETIELNAIRLENINNPNLQEIIKNIKNEGYDLYLFDLSDNYQLPVIMSMIIDKERNSLNFNLGAFPVFDIAAERVLTELYQGIKSYHDYPYKHMTQVPYKGVFPAFVYGFYGNNINGKIMPMQVFKNMKYKDDYNHRVFISRNNDNKSILDYFIELGKEQNYKFYYLDNSLSKDIYAVHILCENDQKEFDEFTFDCYWDDLAINTAVVELKKYNDFYDSILNGESNCSILLDLVGTNGLNEFFFGTAIMWDDLAIYSKDNRSFGMLNWLFGDLDMGNLQVPMNFNETIIEKQFRKYYTLRSYAIIGQYTDEELFYIFNEIFNFNITQNDINNCFNAAYILKEVYIKPLQEFLNGDSFKDIINTYIK